MTTGDGGLSPSSSVVPAVDAPPAFFAGGGGRIAVDDSATATATATATGDTCGHPGVVAGSRRRLVLVRPKFPADEADGKKPSSTSGVAEDAASSSGNGATGLPAPRKIRIASRRSRTDTAEKGSSSPRLALPWTATAVTSQAMPPASKVAKRRKLVRPFFGEGAVRTLRISGKADASIAVEALQTGQDVKIAISEDLALGEASDVAHMILPFYPRLLEGTDLLLLCNKISEEAAVNSRLQINQSALAVLETQSRDLHLSISRDAAMLR